MRNLKRALSLTLASVMLLGMMVVGSGAVGYDDVDESNNVEAIEVLQEIEVMVGDERGFGPDRPVNRAEMAVVMGKLLNLDYNYYSAACPFNDVYDWARGYVGACAANKIVSGRGDGIYDPGATVTAVEAASMLMRALGYFQYANDVADGFVLSTVREGNKIGIFDDVDATADSAMTRNQVAQMVLNALQSSVVEPDGNTTTFLNPDGTVLATTGKVNYVSVTSSKPFATAISRTTATSVGSNNDGYIVELGERLYDGKLKLSNTTDAFQRPARHWEFDGKDVGTYVKKELLRQEYTVKVTGKMLYDLITKPTIDDYDFTIAVDGIECVTANKNDLDIAYFTKGNLIRSNTEKVGETGKGVLTQVFVDPDTDHVYIAVINTYLAKANSDYNSRKDEVDFEVWSVEDVADNKNNMRLVKNTDEKETLTVKGEDFAIEDVKDGDIVLVNVAEGEIKVIMDPEVVDNTEISAFKDGDWVNAGGTQYDYADAIQYDDEVLDIYDDYNMKDTTYRVFLDKYGYALGVEIIDANDQYVFVTGIDKSTHNLTNKTADGNLIFTDGTMKTAKIDMDKSVAADGESDLPVVSLLNTWCKYTVNSDGVYTLTEIANDNDSFKKDDRGNVYTDLDKTDKIGQGRDIDITDYQTANNNDDKNNDTPADFLTLDKSHIYLSSKIDGFKTVYTDDDTVFIAVTTGEIKASQMYSTTPFTDWSADESEGWVVAIDDVDSVATGARNINMKVWNAAKVFVEGFKEGDLTQGRAASVDNTTTPTKVTNQTDMRKVSSGAYTLFSDKGYVIATVVVGEDDGSTSNYAYVTSGDAKREAYDKANDEYTWEREVIINGKLVDITEKGDNRPAIRGMAKGNWYEVKYKADGTVKSVTNLSTHTISPSIIMPVQDFDSYPTGVAYADGKYIQAIEDYEAAVDENDTVLLWDNLTDVEYEVSVQGNTLQVETASGKKNGFSVSGDCKVVLIQDKKASRGGWAYMDDIEEYAATGTAGLKAMVKDLNDNEAFVGFIGAVFEGKLATSVVVYDKTETEIDEGEDFDGGEDVYAHTEDSGDITITTSKTLTARQIAATVKSHLNDADIDTVEYNTSTKRAVITYKDGTTTNISVTVTKVANKAAVQGADLLNKVQDDISSNYGTITIEGNHMTATGATTDYLDPDDGEDDTSQATLDFVNFLVGLNAKKAKKITFDSVDYKWNSGIRYASKWLKDGGTVDANGEPTTAADTLVTAVVTEITTGGAPAAGGSKDIVLTVDGAEIVFTIAIAPAS